MLIRHTRKAELGILVPLARPVTPFYWVAQESNLFVAHSASFQTTVLQTAAENTTQNLRCILWVGRRSNPRLLVFSQALHRLSYRPLVIANKAHGHKKPAAIGDRGLEAKSSSQAAESPVPPLTEVIKIGAWPGSIGSSLREWVVK